MVFLLFTWYKIHRRITINLYLKTQICIKIFLECLIIIVLYISLLGCSILLYTKAQIPCLLFTHLCIFIATHIRTSKLFPRHTTRVEFTDKWIILLHTHSHWKSSNVLCNMTLGNNTIFYSTKAMIRLMCGYSICFQ